MLILILSCRRLHHVKFEFSNTIFQNSNSNLTCLYYYNPFWWPSWSNGLHNGFHGITISIVYIFSGLCVRGTVIITVIILIMILKFIHSQNAIVWWIWKSSNCSKLKIINTKFIQVLPLLITSLWLIVNFTLGLCT